MVKQPKAKEDKEKTVVLERRYPDAIAKADCRAGRYHQASV